MEDDLVIVVVVILLPPVSELLAACDVAIDAIATIPKETINSVVCF